MTVIDQYLTHIEPLKRKELLRIREIIKKAVPESEECINYGMPTMKYKGTSFLGFDVHMNHIGIYPYGGAEIEILKDVLIKHHYEYSKGTIRIPFDMPIPELLLMKIIALRIQRIISVNKKI